MPIFQRRASVSCVSSSFGSAGWHLSPPQCPGAVPLHLKHKCRECEMWQMKPTEKKRLREMRGPKAQFHQEEFCTLEMLPAFLSSRLQGRAGQGQEITFITTRSLPQRSQGCFMDMLNYQLLVWITLDLKIKSNFHYPAGKKESQQGFSNAMSK